MTVRNNDQRSRVNTKETPAERTQRDLAQAAFDLKLSNAGKGRLVWGAAAIAETIGRSLAQTYCLLENGFLPARRVGRQWVADEGALLSIGDPIAGYRRPAGAEAEVKASPAMQRAHRGRKRLLKPPQPTDEAAIARKNSAPTSEE
jgi:hypothetical protein